MHLSRKAARGMLLASGVTVLAAGAALAQGPPGGFGGPNMAAMQKWRDQHKYTFKLRSMLTNGIMELERDKATALKPDQAKKTLAVLTPLTKKPKLTQDEARASIKKLQTVFDSRQLASVETAVTNAQRRMGGGRRGGPGGPGGGGPPGGFGGGRPGGGGPPGGFGGPPGGRPGGGPGGPGGGPGGTFNAAAMKDFNPFNPQKDSFGYDRNKERNQKLIAFLQARAAGKKATLEMPMGFGGGRGGGRGGPGGGPGGFGGPRPGGGPPRGGPGAPPPPPGR